MNHKNEKRTAISAELVELLRKYNKENAQLGMKTLLKTDQRFEDFSVSLPGMLLDFSRTTLDSRSMDLLLEAAQSCSLEQRRDELFSGAHVNLTEDRPALHMALRSPDVLENAGGDEAALVKDSMQKMLAAARDLHQGQLPGSAGTNIRHIIHVGIGGSLLGPQLVCQALDQGDSEVSVHFLGSVDAGTRERLLKELDPGETMVVLVSKSFTTGDTLLHGRRLEAWLQNTLGSEGTRQRLFAVSSNVEKAVAFGIDPAHILYFSDWVGGRYSLWSPVSLSAAALIGPDRFKQLLNGGALMDKHFSEAPLEKNLPVIWGLTGVWHRNVCDNAAWGVMPYDQRLKLLPAYLQQLIMESNGKSIRTGGERSELQTAPVIFGETGTEAQHSVFQAMHQGTDVVPLNFIGICKPEHDDREAHDELLANLLAQLTALACGRTAGETRAEMGSDTDEALLAHRTFAGNRPSELIMLDELTPVSLGMLLALYEHKVFVESVLWDINAFDQWGVELGKSLAPGIQAALSSGEGGGKGLDGLLQHIKKRR